MPVEIVFGLLLATSVVLGHDYIVKKLRGIFTNSHSHYRRLALQFALTSIYAILAAVIFSIGFWDYVMKMPISSEYLFDYAILGLFIPILVNGTTESLYYYGEWEKEVDKKLILQKENIRVKYEALQNQLNPHFLFNCFNTLSVLINESKQVANQFLQELSRVFRFILELKDSEVIQLKEELEALKAYIYLMKYRFGENFHVNIDINTQYEHMMIPPLTLQILMENALKHNDFDENEPLQVAVSTDNHDQLTFKNNLTHKSTPESTHTGLDNLIRRYQFISESSVQIVQSENTFSVTVPLINVENI